MYFILATWKKRGLTFPITRHVITYHFAPAVNNPLKAKYDGKAPIPIQSVTSTVKSLIGKDKDNPDYVKVIDKQPDPITGNMAEVLAPIEEAWENRRMFDD
jgi:hypothetical protein